MADGRVQGNALTLRGPTVLVCYGDPGPRLDLQIVSRRSEKRGAKAGEGATRNEWKKTRGQPHPKRVWTAWDKRALLRSMAALRADTAQTLRVYWRKGRT